MDRFIESEINSLGVGGVSSLVDTPDKKDTMIRLYITKGLKKWELPGWLMQCSDGLSDNAAHSEPGHRRKPSSLRNT